MINFEDYAWLCFIVIFDKVYPKLDSISRQDLNTLSFYEPSNISLILDSFLYIYESLVKSFCEIFFLHFLQVHIPCKINIVAL